MYGVVEYANRPFFELSIWFCPLHFLSGCREGLCVDLRPSYSAAIDPVSLAITDPSIFPQSHPEFAVLSDCDNTNSKWTADLSSTVVVGPTTVVLK